MADLALSSPAFDDGEPMPDRCGYTADDVDPPLSVSGVPAEAASLLLLVADADADDPARRDHWPAWDVPPDRETIPEGWSPATATEGRNDYGEIGYGGPTTADGEHTIGSG